MGVVFLFAEHCYLPGGCTKKFKKMFDINTAQNATLLEKDCGLW